MGNQSDRLRAVIARNEAGTRVPHARTESNSSVSSPARAGSTMATQTHPKSSMSFSGFCLKTIVAMVLTLGVVYGANEVMQVLLK